MSDNDLSYCELRSKEVVNDTDGRRMGRIVDILFSRDDGRISGIVVPLNRRGIFSKNQDVFVPWHCVRKIGEDVILVSLTMEADGSLPCGHRPPPPPRPKPPKDCKHGGGYESCGCGDNTFREETRCDDSVPPHPNCDNRCEKCMLFDCAYRWSQMN